MSLPPGLLFQLYPIPVDDVLPSESETLVRIMEVEKPYFTMHSDVVDWISVEFENNPTRFLRYSSTLLVVEVKYTRQ